MGCLPITGWWFGTWLLFSNFSIMYGNVMIPIDELIFFKMVIAPPTSNEQGSPKEDGLKLNIATTCPGSGSYGSQP